MWTVVVFGGHFAVPVVGRLGLAVQFVGPAGLLVRGAATWRLHESAQRAVI